MNSGFRFCELVSTLNARPVSVRSSAVRFDWVFQTFPEGSIQHAIHFSQCSDC